MIVGIGTDIVEVPRIKQSIEKYGDRFLNRIFTQTEIEYCDQYGDGRYLHYAARFAAKEAFSKAIGTGITKGFKFREVGIRNHKTGRPEVELEGGLQQKWGGYSIVVSLSHTDNNAIAFLTLEKY
ncbi:MAG: holo-ACP synthase [Candidatus Kapaibacterium sp.]